MKVYSMDIIRKTYPNLTDEIYNEIERVLHAGFKTEPSLMFDWDKKLAYTRSVYRDVSNTLQLRYPVPRGQLKLFTETLLTLTLAFEKCNIQTVLYIGAAPGTNIIAISKLFPAINFYLYDPASFDPELFRCPNVTIINTFFTESTVELYRDMQDLLFISDIRTGRVENLEGNSGDSQFEICVARDMQLQMEWTVALNPTAASLKFRPPYIETDDVLIEYLDGILIKQPFSRNTSTEGRLTSFRPYTTRTYSSKEYQDMMFYYNTITREWVRYHCVPPAELEGYARIMPGLCTCEDCTIFIACCKKYNPSIAAVAKTIKTVYLFLRQSPDYGNIRHGYGSYNSTRLDDHISVILYSPAAHAAKTRREAHFKTLNLPLCHAKDII